MKKRWLLVLIPLLLVCNLMIRVPLSVWSRIGNERTIAKLPEQIQSSFEGHGDVYLETAKALTNMLEHQGLRSTFVCRDKTVKQALPTALSSTEARQMREQAQQTVSDLLEITGIPFDRIFIPHRSVYYYPEDAVIFRCVVMENGEEYCWIDLIYSPLWQQHKTEKRIHTVLGKDLSTQIAENWCMVILYRE